MAPVQAEEEEDDQLVEQQEACDNVDDLQDAVDYRDDNLCGRSMRSQSSSKTYISNLEKQLKDERDRRTRLELEIQQMQRNNHENMMRSG